MKYIAAFFMLFLFLVAFKNPGKTIINSTPVDTILFPGESHFINIQQLTFGGDNAEAYFSFDGNYLVFQRTDPAQGIKCDQIWMGKIPGQGEKFSPKLVSTGTGRTTCAA